MTTTTKPKQDRLGQLISQLDSTTNAATGTKLFANKSDLEAAEKRIKELEAENKSLKASPLGAQLTAAQATITRLQSENQALRTRPLAVTPTKTATTPAKVSPAPAKPSTSTAAQPTVEFQPTPIITLSREKFNALTPADKSRFFREGGKIID